MLGAKKYSYDVVELDGDGNYKASKESCLLHDFSRESFMQRLRYEKLKSLAKLKKCVHV